MYTLPLLIPNSLPIWFYLIFQSPDLLGPLRLFGTKSTIYKFFKEINIPIANNKNIRNHLGCNGLHLNRYFVARLALRFPKIKIIFDSKPFNTVKSNIAKYLFPTKNKPTLKWMLLHY